MINDNTILSSFDDKPTLLEWLKKVEDALKTDTATAVSVENPSANTYVFKITFADGKTLSSGNVVFPDSVKDVSIKNGHIIVTQISGTQTDLGAINPYADTIVVNASTNTTEIRNNVEVGGKLQVNGEAQVTGNVAMGGNLGVTGQAVVGGTLQAGSLQVNSNESVGGGLSVEGSLSAKGGIITAGKITANDGIEVHGQGYVNGALGVTGNATIAGTITAGGKAIKAVEANPTGEATATLEKVKIGDVSYNVGGGGSENDRVLTLVLPYPRSEESVYKSVIIDDDTIWNNINNYYYETIKIYYNDGNPLGIFNVLFHFHSDYREKHYACITNTIEDTSYSEWYGRSYSYYRGIRLSFNPANKSVNITDFGLFNQWSLDKSKFDALYKLADKPTQDGNYILKASVSGGNVTYTWELQQ